MVWWWVVGGKPILVYSSGPTFELELELESESDLTLTLTLSGTWRWTLTLTKKNSIGEFVSPGLQITGRIK